MINAVRMFTLAVVGPLALDSSLGFLKTLAFQVMPNQNQLSLLLTLGPKNLCEIIFT